MKLKPKMDRKDVDTLWAKAVKDRDGWTCQICGRNCGKIGGHAHAHHIMRKQSTFMRYSLENGICLCAGCHKFGVHSPDGETASRMLATLIRRVGMERWERLVTAKHNPPKMKLHEAYEQLSTGKE